MPAISVIVPVYKVEAFLPACVASILGQTFADFELILVDDGSPDGCGALCDAYTGQDARVRVIHRQNGGLSAARNSGIAAATGEFLAFVDADDLVAPDYLERLHAALHTTGADMALCAVEDVNEDGSPLEHPEITAPAAAGSFSGKALLAEFFGPNATCYTVAWNKLYKRSRWEQLRYPEGLIHEDDAVAHRLFATCEKVACLTEPLYRYRLRQGSICRSGISPGSFDGVTAHADWCRFFRDEGFDKPLLDKALAACFRRYLSLCAGAKTELSWPIAARWHSTQAELRCLLPLLKTCGELTLPEKLSCLRWCTRPLPLPPKKELPRAALLMPPALPVPAVKGGAVEGLATRLVEENQTRRRMELAVVTVLDEQAAVAAARFSQTLFCFVRPASPVRRALYSLTRRVRALAGRGVHWNVYYSQALPFLRALHPDHLVAEGGDLTGWQQVSRAFGKERMVAHLHGLTHASPLLDRCYGHVLALSEYIRGQWLATSALDPKNALLLYNCVPVERFAAPPDAQAVETLRQQLELSADDFVVLFCGRLEEDKGVHKLVEAMALIPDPAVKLVVVGGSFFAASETTPFTRQLQALAKPLAGRIRFTGYVPAGQLPAYYHLAQVTVMPTLVEEAAGLVAVEAMAAGCPLIATQSGGLPEYAAGSNAILLPRDESLPAAIAESVLALKADPGRRAEMAAAGRRRATEFSAPRYYDAFLQAFQQMEDETHGPDQRDRAGV